MKNKTPFHIALENNSTETVELLISKGANINITYLCYINIIVLFLVKSISNKWRKLNKKNKTPLHYAAEKNSKEIGELLISKGADINAKDIIYLNIKILFLINII